MVYYPDTPKTASMNNAELAVADRQRIAEKRTSLEACDNLMVLCEDYGSPFGGAEGEKGGRDSLLRKLAECGLRNVHNEALRYEGWRRGNLQLQTREPVQKEVEAIALPYTGTATVEDELPCLGHATPRDFESHSAEIPGRLSGRLVITASRSPLNQGRTVPRPEKYRRAVAAGAKALRIMREELGLVASSGSLRYGRPSEIPGVRLSRHMGDGLLRLARRGPVKLRLIAQDTIEETSSWNMVGELPGASDPQSVVVIGAHFDGHGVVEATARPSR